MDRQSIPEKRAQQCGQKQPVNIHETILVSTIGLEGDICHLSELLDLSI